MISKGFFESLEDIANDRSLNIEKILEKVEYAMQIACKNSDCPYKGEIRMETNYERKVIAFYDYHHVVSEIDPEGIRGQILLEDAQEIKPKIKMDQEFREKIDLKVFKRKAASMFRQTLLNELKGLEREEAYDFFITKVGEIVTGRIIGKNERFITIALKAGVEATMSLRDAIPGEEFSIGDELKVYVNDVQKTTKGPRIHISRNNNNMVKQLFELNIPEVASGQIEIKAIAREVGNRTKVGVISLVSDVDAKGSCVGSKGSRIKNINNALNGEKIDIFLWSDDPNELVANALAPATIISVTTDEAEKKAEVVVADDQFSLAIGKSGQNVKLAAIASGWKIDIKKASEQSE
ncbi:MAG: transcription termination factor NusA [Bacilli bacterium]